MRVSSERFAAGVGLLLALLSLSPLARGQSDEKHISISGPDGTVHIGTAQADVRNMGLSVYPGATITSGNDDDEKGANVSVESSEGATRVQVMNFDTTDSADKVLTFYKRDMARYGNVLECRDGKQVSFDVRDPAHKSELTCERDGGHDDASTILKSGTKNSGHAVVVQKKGDRTEFTLIRVENSHAHETL